MHFEILGKKCRDSNPCTLSWVFPLPSRPLPPMLSPGGVYEMVAVCFFFFLFYGHTQGMWRFEV